MSRRQSVSYEDLRRNVADLTKMNADLTNKTADHTKRNTELINKIADLEEKIELVRNDKSKELRDQLSVYEAQVGLHCTPMHACINIHMCVCALVCDVR